MKYALIALIVALVFAIFCMALIGNLDIYDWSVKTRMSLFCGWLGITALLSLATWLYGPVDCDAEYID